MSRITTPARRFFLTALLVMTGSALLLQACGGGGGGGGAPPPVATPPPNNVPRFAYVANQGDNTVSQYTVNATTGQLRHNGYVFAGTAPVAVAVNPAGTLAYVVNQTSGSVSAYSINTNGTLTPISCVFGGAVVCSGGNFPTGTAPQSITIDPTGKFAYVVNSFSGGSGNSVSAYTIDTTTGTPTSGFLTPVAGSPFPTTLGTSPQSVTVNPAGTFAYVANSGGNVSAYAINPTSGVLTPVMGSPFPAGASPQSVTLNPAGTFAYVANSFNGGGGNSVSAYTINANGTLTPINCVGGAGCSGTNFATGTSPQSVTVNPAGTFAYVANGGGNVSAYAINPTSGVLTPVVGSPFLAGASPESVSVDPSGKFAYVTNATSRNISTYNISASTGALTAAALPTVTARNTPAGLAMTKGTALVYTPRFAYVTNRDSNDVSAYTITATGALTQINCSGAGCSIGNNFAAGGLPIGATVDPSGKFAYVTNFGPVSNSISAYRIDAAGALTPVPGSPFAAGTRPVSVAVDPSGKFVYVANFFNGAGGNSVSAYTIDAATGALTQVDADSGTAGIQNFPAGTTPRSVTVDPTGKFAYVANSFNGTGGNSVSAYTIDAVSGALSPVTGSPFTAGVGPASVTVDPSGKFAYVANGFDGAGGNSVSAYTIDAATGALTQVDADSGTAGIQNFPAGRIPQSVTVDPTGKFAYVANNFFGDVSAYIIDAATGALTPVTNSPFTAGSQPESVTVDSSGRFAYVANFSSDNVSAYNIDAATGALTAVTGSPFTAGTRSASVVTTGTIQ